MIFQLPFKSIFAEPSLTKDTFWQLIVRLISPKPTSHKDKCFDFMLDVLDNFADPSTYIKEIYLVVNVSCVQLLHFREVSHC